MLTFTKEQLSEVMCQHAEKENGAFSIIVCPLRIQVDLDGFRKLREITRSVNLENRCF